MVETRGKRIDPFHGCYEVTMAITPHEAAADKAEEELKKLKDIEAYIDEKLKSEFWHGSTVRIDVVSLPHTYNTRMFNTLKTRYLNAGWKVSSSSHMNEQYLDFSEKKDRPSGMRC